MIKHISFSKDGLPDAIFDTPRDSTEPLDVSFIDGDPITFLAAHRRVDGKWLPRLPVVTPPPSPEEIAAQAEADARAAAEAEAAAAEARELEIVRLAGPDQLLRSMGKITIAELAARVAAIRVRVEGPG